MSEVRLVRLFAFNYHPAFHLHIAVPDAISSHYLQVRCNMEVALLLPTMCMCFCITILKLKCFMAGMVVFDSFFVLSSIKPKRCGLKFKYKYKRMPFLIAQYSKLFQQLLLVSFSCLITSAIYQKLNEIV